MVGTSTSDDAGVFRIAPDRALVQTVDFFTPVVNDAYDWGRIAAANALSDIYAMGATPLTALQLVGWPRDELSFELLGRVLEGGADVIASSGTVIVGGHSIDDAEPKYGFAVTGEVHPDRIITNGGAQPGDRLVLTKPLGTGIIATSIKAGTCPDEVAAVATESMATLNDKAAEAMVTVGVNAATDVTGFGLVGHLREIVAASRVSAVLATSEIPLLPSTTDLLAAGHFPGGSVRNMSALEQHLIGGSVDERQLMCDAQTSGGLLISVAPQSTDALLTQLAERDQPAWTIGSITADPTGSITLA